MELFKYPVLKQFLDAYGAFPVRRGEADLAALRRANEALKQGLALVHLPRRHRAARRRQQLREAWPGAALIALRSDVPVLPMAITGSQRLGLPQMFLRPFPRQHVTLTYRQALRAGEAGARQRRGSARGDAADHGAHRRAVAA